jgi:Holliday junction resolvase RusA-like endonuclease
METTTAEIKTITLTISGKPMGKGRPKFRSTGKYVQTYTPTETANYENLVRLCYMQQYGNNLAFGDDEELEARITAYYDIPKSYSKKKTQQAICNAINPITKPDTDNIAKIILDSLNSVAYHDDSRVVNLVVKKRYSDNPRVEVTISNNLTIY